MKLILLTQCQPVFTLQNESFDAEMFPLKLKDSVISEGYLFKKNKFVQNPKM